MGTRADFYIAKEKAELQWVGSIAFDGYEIDGVEMATTEQGYLNIIQQVMAPRRDFTSPEQGWPWPWNNSKLTDEVYVFADGQVWRSYKYEGSQEDHTTPMLFASFKDVEKLNEDNAPNELKVPTRSFLMPDMSGLKNVSYGDRSGLIVVSD